MPGASGRELGGEAVRQGALTDKLAERRRRERPSRAGQDPLMDAALRKDAVEKWAGERIGEVSASTFNKELWVLKNLCKCAVEWGYMKANPAQSVKRMRESKGRIRYLETEERDSLLREAKPALRLYIAGRFKLGLGEASWYASDGRTSTLGRAQ
jgi:hypothetical protein